jgi:hypothetical protein
MMKYVPFFVMAVTSSVVCEAAGPAAAGSPEQPLLVAEARRPGPTYKKILFVAGVGSLLITGSVVGIKLGVQDPLQDSSRDSSRLVPVTSLMLSSCNAVCPGPIMMSNLCHPVPNLLDPFVKEIIARTCPDALKIEVAQDPSARAKFCVSLQQGLSIVGDSCTAKGKKPSARRAVLLRKLRVQQEGLRLKTGRSRAPR